MTRDAPAAPDTLDTRGYREAEIRPLCATCGELGEWPCLRCGRPFCADHTPADDQRCERCERSFERRTRLWSTSSTLALQLGVALPFLLFGRPSVDSAAWKLRVRRWARRRFLRERKR